MHFLSHIGMFTLQALVIVTSILILFAGIAAIGKKPKLKLEINSFNNQEKNIAHQMQKEILGKIKKTKKIKKEIKSKVYVIDFNGDIKASQVEALRDEISAVLTIADSNDEVIIRLESPGGAVNSYGLAAAQLQRLRDRHLKLTVCIDKVAASGGYLMACVANTIVAAPFAIIGSIGVVAQLPNFHRWLQKNSIDVELLTAGEYKRTLTMFGENTDKGRNKFKEDLELIHKNFRNYVLVNREQLNIDQVSTGEHWLASDAADLHLVDIIQTSDEYLRKYLATHEIYEIKINTKKTLFEKILSPATKLLSCTWM